MPVRRPRWASVLVALWLVLACGSAIPAVAQSDLDVRGTWDATVVAQDGTKFPSTLLISDQSAGGTLDGHFDIHGKGASGRMRGTLDGSTMALTSSKASGGYRYTGKVSRRSGGLTWTGTWVLPSHTQWHGTVRARLSKPLVRKSPQGGTGTSATMVVCDRDMTANTDDAVLECTALVTDASGQPGSTAPTGDVRWTTEVGTLAPGTCTLHSDGGSTAWCAVALRARSGEISIGTAPPVTAAYPGDEQFGPSEGSPQLYGAGNSYDESDQYGPGCNPASGPYPSFSCGDPVNPATGNLVMSAIDLEVGGRGPGLAVDRTYNSLAAASGETGRFGAGWSDGYGARIDTGRKGVVTVVLGTGATVPFTSRGKRFTAPGWVTASLARSAGKAYVLTFADGRTFTFDRRGRLTTVSDRSREPVSLDYAEDGTIAAATDASGRSITFTSDASGRVVGAVDPAGRQATYVYDEAGDLVGVADVAGGVTSYTYDDRHRLVSVIRPDAAATTNRYDADSRVVEQVDPLGNTMSLTYSGSYPDLLTFVTDGNGNRSGWEFRGGVPVAETRSLDSEQPSTTSYLYDAQLRSVGQIDALGRIWRVTRDPAGNVLTSTDPLGRVSSATYDKHNDLLSVVSPMGIMTRLTYDDRGLLLRIVDAEGSPDEATTSIARDDPEHPSDITAVTDPTGAVTTFRYDDHGDAVSRTDALGNTESDTRDILGRLASITDPLGAVTSVVRDPFGHPTSITDPLGDTTLLAWDANGRQAALTDALGNVTATEYDATGRPVAATLADGTVTRAGYDAIGDLTRLIDGNGTVYTLAYDAQGRPVSWADPLGGTWRVTRDLAGQASLTSDPLGQQTQYTRDASGRPVAVDYAGATADVTFTYDADGRRVTMTDGTGTTSYVWDAQGRLTAVTDGAGQTVVATYDAAGRLTSITYPHGGRVEWDHDASGRVTAVRDWLGHETTFSWDAAGRLVGLRQGDGSTTTRTLDARGDLVGIEVSAADQTTPLLSFDYQRDALGRVASERGSLDASPRDVSRDSRGRLIAVGDESFQVDAAGQIVGLRGYTLAYDAAGRLLSANGADGSNTYTMDAAGQRTSSATGTDQPTRYTWDAAGRLTTIGSTSHTYDGDGLRMTSTLGDGSTSRFTWFRGSGLPMLLGDGSSWFIQGPDGMPIEEVRADGSVQWLHVDQAGSVRAVTDESGVLTGTFTWDAYGLPVTSTGAAHTRIGFQGSYTDPDTGLVYLQARYYDPATAQFLSADPMVPSTLQPFAFADGDPLTFADPAGTQSIIGGGTAAAGSAARMLEGLGLAGATCSANDDTIDRLQADLEARYSESTTDRFSDRLFRAVAKQNVEGATAMLRGERPMPTIPGGMYAAILRAQEREYAMAAQRLQIQLVERMRTIPLYDDDTGNLVVRDLNDMFSGNGSVFHRPGRMMGH